MAWMLWLGHGEKNGKVDWMSHAWYIGAKLNIVANILEINLAEIAKQVQGFGNQSAWWNARVSSATKFYTNILWFPCVNFNTDVPEIWSLHRDQPTKCRRLGIYCILGAELMDKS